MPSPPSGHSPNPDSCARLAMLIKSWRCDMPSCKTLEYGSEVDVRIHQAAHLSELSHQWEPDSICPWPNCRSSTSGTTFKSISCYKKHLKTHMKSYWCDRPGCKYDKPFGTTYDLYRHVQTAHNNAALCCPLDHCSQRFFRRDKLEEHIRAAHSTCICSFDHCGMIILDTQATKDAHLVTFHHDKPNFECTLPGCESTTSSFDQAGATRHLCHQHGLTYGQNGTATRFLDRVKLRQRGDIKTITLHSRGKRQRIRPCNGCAQKVAASAFESQAIGEGNEA